MNTRTRYFAMLDDETVLPLGSHESFDGAGEQAPGRTHWIFTETGLRAFVEQAQTALDTNNLTNCKTVTHGDQA